MLGNVHNEKLIGQALKLPRLEEVIYSGSSNLTQKKKHNTKMGVLLTLRHKDLLSTCYPLHNYIALNQYCFPSKYPHPDEIFHYS